jgi:hypothetical protein
VLSFSRSLFLWIGIALTASAAAGQGTEAPRVDSVASRTAKPPDVAPLPELRPSPLTLVNSERVDQLRTDELALGVPLGGSLLLRSASSLTPGRPGASIIAPQFLFVNNSALPFSQNNGALWAGKGASTRILTGFKIEGTRARLIFAPEIVSVANLDWQLNPIFYLPPMPPGYNRSGYVLPYYFYTFPIDQPMRFGANFIRRFDLGQSTAMLSLRHVQLGVSNENEWWGPGIRNAIVLSNNAPGFPHLFFRTARPIDTRLGAIEMRWLVGGLTESRYFDTVFTNNVRSLAAFSATLQTKWDPNLSFGFARSVYGTAKGWGEIPWRWLDVFARTNVGKKGPLVPHSDTTLTPGGKDQILSLFVRWVLPHDGVEIYAEWARRLLAPSLRDFLVAPNHTQGYTLGAQWRAAPWHSGTFRIQTEVTQLEQSATFRDEPVGSWYTSRRVVQGYTNRGEVIGASIGPGASSQWLALDYLKPSWRLGAFAGRIRLNEDVHSTFGFPDYVGYCNHDVTIYPGLRGAKTGRLGSISAELSLQNRVTPFFQNGGGCPNVGTRLDVRNKMLSISFSPFDHN